MNRIIANAVFGAVMSVSAAGQAAHVSGTNLHAWCLSASRAQQGLCDGYIEGIADAMEESKTTGGFTACIPAAVRIRRTAHVYEVVKRFLASHPERRHLSAIGLVANAFQEAFPCH